MKKLLIFILLVLVFSSCNTLRMIDDFIMSLSVEKQSDETPSEVAGYLKKYDFIYDYSLFQIDSITIKTMNKSKHNLNPYSKNVSAIQLRIYDKYGNLYTGFTQCMNSFVRNKFLGNDYPPHENEYDINETLELESEYELWNCSDDLLSKIKEDASKSEYTFVVYWNIWTQGLSRNVLREVTRYKKKFSDKDILVVLVNNASDPEN